jgi:hypothetical protein
LMNSLIAFSKIVKAFNKKVKAFSKLVNVYTNFIKAFTYLVKAIPNPNKMHTTAFLGERISNS